MSPPSSRFTRRPFPEGICGNDAVDEARTAIEAHPIEELQRTVERLQLELDELRESRRRRVLAADADRRAIERALHEGVQQDLVALADNLQLTGALLESDPAGAKRLVDEMTRDVKQALDATALAADPSPAPSSGRSRRGGALGGNRSWRQASIDVAAGDGRPPEFIRTVYLFCIDALDQVGPEGTVTISVRPEQGALVCDVTAQPHAELERLRDRVEALGGRLAIESKPETGTRASASLGL